MPLFHCCNATNLKTNETKKQDKISKVFCNESLRPTEGGDTSKLIGYDKHFVCSSTETNLNASGFMNLPADAQRHVSYSEVYNGELLCELLQP